VIRSATVDDAAALAGVEVRAFRHAYAEILSPGFLDDMDPEERTSAWLKALADPATSAWVVQAGGRVAGYALVRGAVLTALYVDPAAQGAGAGTALLEVAEQAGAAELEVFEANGHGRGFYEDRGWRDAGPAGEWLEQSLRRYVRA
jgi:ribosomal protein S18 acetylase RimI-like enzyme